MNRCLIVFDLDTKCLDQNYHNSSWQNAYSDIRTDEQQKRVIRSLELSRT